MSKLFKLSFLVSILFFLNNINDNVAAALGSSDVSSETKLNLDAPQRVDEGFAGELIWVLVVLVFVICLLYFTMKFLANKNKAFLSPKGIQSLGGIGVGPNSSVQVLKIGNNIYIVGVGQQVTLIDKEADPEVVAEILESFSSDKQASFITFKDGLSSLLQKRRINESEVTNSDWNNPNSNANTFETLLQSKLDKQAERKQQLESLLKDNKE